MAGFFILGEFWVCDGMQGGGYGRALMGDLIDTGKLLGVDIIKLRAERIGRLVWVKMGFLPTDDAWLQSEERLTISF
jgi:GNAT superfamily N-acetyltransferase